MGVPALMTWHGVDWDEGGVEAGQAAWDAKFGADYHKVSDEWSADWDLRSAVENLTLLYQAGSATGQRRRMADVEADLGVRRPSAPRSDDARQ